MAASPTAPTAPPTMCGRYVIAYDPQTLVAGAWSELAIDPVAHAVARQLSPLACAGYRARTAANVLAKFWAGEGFARAARSPRARGWGERLIRGQAAAWFNRTISAVLDDKGATA